MKMNSSLRFGINPFSSDIGDIGKQKEIKQAHKRAH